MADHATGVPERPRKRWSVRARTTAAAVLVMMPVLTGAGAVGVWLQHRELERTVALVAEEQARTVARDDVVANQLGGEESLVQVVDARGQVVGGSRTLQGVSPLTPDPGSSVTHVVVAGERFGEDGEYLVASAPRAGGGYVSAARSLETVGVATASTVRLLVVGIPGVLLLTGSLCWILAGRSLRPVEELRARAAGISTASDGSRLPLPGTGDEIERLAETLNAMLGRIDDAVRAQRQFVADASHELRSPVAAVRTVMEVQGPGPPEWEEARRDVLSETERMARLVDAMLFLAKHDAATAVVPRSDVALVDLAEEQAARPRRVPVQVTGQATADPHVWGDPAALATAVGNLVDNAARHATTSVEIRVESRTEPDGAWAYLRVMDDGAGIPEDQRERVFERFARLDEARSRDAGGAGLGLAITRDITTDHGGTVVVDSTHPGAALVIRLPLAK